ncbi:MAG: hypothetical protein ACYDCH_15480, partial [Gaiellaceae bacterium]
MNAAGLVDAAAPGRVLVFGSLPPAARDLDLLVLPDERTAIEHGLRNAGYEQRGDEWVRFADGGAHVVELSSPSDFGIADPELERVLAEALPLDGFDRLVAPAPADDLLVLAALLRLGGWKEKRRARLELATGAFAAARPRAARWGVRDELAALERIARGERPRPVRGRARPSRPRVVAFSGIDGSGKSTQARILRETLHDLGYEPAIAWTPLSQNASLARLAGPVKHVLRLLRRTPPPAAPGETGLHRDEGTELRSRSAVVLFAWTMLVALANGAFHARTAARHAAAGRVVIFDRYLLDTAAQFRFRYGE